MVDKGLHSVYILCDAALIAYVGVIVDRIVAESHFDDQSPEMIAAAVHEAITDLATHVTAEHIAARVELRRKDNANG